MSEGELDQEDRPTPAGVDDLVTELLDRIAPGRSRRHIAALLRTTVALAMDGTDPLNLKIAAAALREMRDAFEMFQPYTPERKYG